MLTTYWSEFRPGASAWGIDARGATGGDDTVNDENANGNHAVSRIPSGKPGGKTVEVGWGGEGGLMERSHEAYRAMRPGEVVPTCSEQALQVLDSAAVSPLASSSLSLRAFEVGPREVGTVTRVAHCKAVSTDRLALASA